MPMLPSRCWCLSLAVLGLMACSKPPTPTEAAVTACIDWAHAQLKGKPIEIDPDVLKASVVFADGGERVLTAPIVINAGLASAETQVLECTVRVAADGKGADVVLARFFW